MARASARPGSGAVLGGVLAALTVAGHVATSRGYGYFRDEFYYLACSARLAFGYVDHPPLTPLLTRVTRALLGDGLPALRLLPALAAAAVVFLTGGMARVLGGGRLAVATASVPVMLAPIFLGVFTVLTTNALEVLAWTLATAILVRLLERDDPRLWLPLGVVMGLGLENKHSVVFLAVGVLAGVLATPTRRHLGTRWPWLGAAAAAGLFLPHLVWQASHGWPTLEFLENARRLKNLAQTPLAFVAEQVLVLNPLAAPVWIAGLGFLLLARAGARWRALGWTYLVVLLLIVAGGGKAYYLAPIYPMLFAAGGVAFERGLPRAGWAVPVVVAATGLLLAPIAKPVLPVERFIPWARALGQDPRAGVGERHELGALPQFFADMHGWPEMVAAVAAVYARLPPDERARACIFGQNYGEAGAVEFFGRASGLPRALAGHNSYHLWGPEGCDLDVVIVLGGDAAALGRWYREVEEAAVFTCEYCMPYESRLPIRVVRGRKVPVAELWPAVKHYE